MILYDYKTEKLCEGKWMEKYTITLNWPRVWHILSVPKRYLVALYHSHGNVYLLLSSIMLSILIPNIFP